MKAEAKKCQALPAAFRPSRAGTSLGLKCAFKGWNPLSSPSGEVTGAQSRLQAQDNGCVSGEDREVTEVLATTSPGLPANRLGVYLSRVCWADNYLTSPLTTAAAMDSVKLMSVAGTN